MLGAGGCLGCWVLGPTEGLASPQGLAPKLGNLLAFQPGWAAVCTPGGVFVLSHASGAALASHSTGPPTVAALCAAHAVQAAAEVEARIAAAQAAAVAEYEAREAAAREEEAAQVRPGQLPAWEAWRLAAVG